MKFTLAQEHIDHFNRTGMIEFYDLFSEQECEDILTKAENALIKRINPTPSNPLSISSNESLFYYGKNIWKEGVDIKKICAKKQLGETAYHLLRKKPIKLAYDQYIRTGTLQDCPFKEDGTIQEISSIRPTLGALLILLTPNQLQAPQIGLPQKAGNALFVSSNVILPLQSLFAETNTSVLMIAFTAGTALYCLEQRDPHTHSLKKAGIVFGDKAGEDLCPTLYYP
jgi:hypothetical protein